MSQISKIERILNLVAFLLKERRPVPWREIAGRVVGYDDETDHKSLERRFERDKAGLKELGIPLRFIGNGTGEGEGYMISREHCFLDPIELSPRETSVLNLLSELGVRRGEKSPELLSALQKLRFDEEPQEGRGSADEEAGAWKRSILRLDQVHSLRQDVNVPKIFEAILEGRVIRFTYWSLSRDETKERIVEPYGLGFARGCWYVVGRDRDRDAMRQFKVARVRGEVETASAPGAFVVPKGFSVRAHLERAIWVGESGEDRGAAEARPERAQLRATVRLSRDIAWLAPGPVSPLATRELPDGAAELVLSVADEDAFLAWCLRHLRHVRVVAPEALRQRLAAAVAALRERHGPGRGAA